MRERISAQVVGLDPISELGVKAQLRSRPELRLVEPAEQNVSPVVLLVADTAGEAALQLIRELRAQRSRQVVLVVTVIDDTALLNAIEVGVSGVVLRQDATPERLVGAVTQAAENNGVLSPQLLGRLLDQVSRLQRQVLEPRGLQLSGMSDREIDVLRLISEGLEIKEIADKLAYSERTIKNALHAVIARFQLRNRAHAVAFAMREGLI
ncbi:response regulator transcription factor [Amycolatopsis sp. SID8362]|uniref:response regulator transcription factor n=1 Tax=Amycolatopsis sp. SID8362 TaxID=2690346 RepID=UPI00136A0558|nr:response regulator transcription factor [Amycolatopsis sp. SID8362]NBH06067.1 DNA-binding response regulator [Amycolatopsis sp. SID8362]NED42766.1 response regulator transcription factor [Amycolatopsis sp. SID8362]